MFWRTPFLHKGGEAKLGFRGLAIKSKSKTREFVDARKTYCVFAFSKYNTDILRLNRSEINFANFYS